MSKNLDFGGGGPGVRTSRAGFTRAKALYLEADPVHLNAAGNGLVAQRLFETMTNQLRQ